jgi:hypothetical protein
MWPFPNPLDLFGDAVGGVVGWAWDKVIQGIYTWFANGLLLLMEWVWNVLDTATTPRVTEAWFTNGLIRPLAGVAVGITVAMMLASAIQAGLGGRPELIIDALKEGPKSLVATALTVVVMDVMIQGGDVLADVAWQAGRGDAQQVLDGLAATMGSSGGLAGTFLGPLALLFGMIGLLVTTVVLFMRSSMLYLVAAFAPIVWSTSVAPMMRGSGRRLIHLVVALVLAKPAIAITLVVGTKLLANAGAPGTTGASSGASALGTMLAGFSCFAIAGLSPAVIFKLLPSVEGGTSATGVAGGWGRSAMTGGADGSDGQVDGSLGGGFRSDPGDAVDFECAGGTTGQSIGGIAGGPGGSTSATGSSSAVATRPATTSEPASTGPTVAPPGESRDTQPTGDLRGPSA